MSNPMSELFSNVDARSCMEMARRYYRFAEAARCETVRQALEDTARAFVHAAGEATQRPSAS